MSCFANGQAMTNFWGPNWGTPGNAVQSRRYVPKAIEFASRCAARNRRLLPYISTADTARDLDYLRRLVGDRKLNYRALSYGTFLGQTYANMFPHNIRAMVIDSVINPVPFVKSTEAGIHSNELGSNAVFKKFETLCQQAGPTRCALAGQGPVTARVRTLLARLRRGPIPAPSAPFPLDYGNALTGFWLAHAPPASWPQFADDLNEAANGDGSALKNRVAGNTTDFLQSMQTAAPLQCADKPVPPPGTIRTWPSVIRRQSTNNVVAPVDYWLLWAPCATGFIRTVNRYSGPWNVTTPNPILILANRYDPRVAYINARISARRLGNAVLVTNNGYGHTTTPTSAAASSDHRPLPHHTQDPAQRHNLPARPHPLRPRLRSTRPLMPDASGVLTPSTAMGTVLVDRLRAAGQSCNHGSTRCA